MTVEELCVMLLERFPKEARVFFKDGFDGTQQRELVPGDFTLASTEFGYRHFCDHDFVLLTHPDNTQEDDE